MNAFIPSYKLHVLIYFHSIVILLLTLITLFYLLFFSLQRLCRALCLQQLQRNYSRLKNFLSQSKQFEFGKIKQSHELWSQKSGRKKVIAKSGHEKVITKKKLESHEIARAPTRSSKFASLTEHESSSATNYHFNCLFRIPMLNFFNE